MRLCLNMIVKDEAHVIEESLNLLKDYICYWVISDTGSSDNTKEIIQKFFDKHNIPGHLFEHKWEDFGTNRTLALEACYPYRKNFDYIWVFDADDLIVGNLKFPKKSNADIFYLRYGKGFTYTRGQVFKATEKWKYVGVLHEYPKCVSKEKVVKEDIEGDYYIDSRRIGNRNKAGDKYQRDAQILEKGLEKEPENERYMFYLAQSYMDCGNFEKAIYWYKKRVEKGGWFEEVYYSLYRIGICMKNREDNWENIEKMFLTAWNFLPSRAEPLYEISHYYRTNDDFEKGYIFAKKGLTIPFPKDQVLFLFKEIYEYKMLDEFAICAFYIRKYKEAFEAGNKLLKNRDIPEYQRKRIENNRDLCIPHILNDYINYPVRKIVDIRSKKDDKKDIIFTITTCKRFDLFQKTINSFISCCKDCLKIQY